MTHVDTHTHAHKTHTHTQFCILVVEWMVSDTHYKSAITHTTMALNANMQPAYSNFVLEFVSGSRDDMLPGKFSKQLYKSVAYIRCGRYGTPNVSLIH